MFVISCCKEEKSLCGPVSDARFTVKNADEFTLFNQMITNSDAVFLASTILQNSITKYYTLYIKPEEICKFNWAIIDFEVTLQHPDT